MPNIQGLEPLPAALSQEAVDACTESYPVGYIVQTLLNLSNWLVNHIGSSILFGKLPLHDPFSPSLRTLLDRLHNGQLGPSRLPITLLTNDHIKVLIHERIEESVSERPLEDFEDLYYAALSSIKETHQRLNDHIRSGFHRPASPISPSGKTIANLNEALSDYWEILNQSGCGKAFDDAIRYAKFEAIRAEIFRLVETNGLSSGDADEQMDELVKLRDDKDLEGMLFVSASPPAMINIMLQQKYSTVMKLEKERFEKRELMKKKKKNKQEKMALKKVTFSDETEVLMSPQPCGHGNRIPPKHIDMKTSVDASHQPSPLLLLQNKTYDPRAQSRLATQSSNNQVLRPTPLPPSSSSSSSHNEIRKSKFLQALEAERAQQDELQAAIEWDMRKQRVSEYKNHLRARASPHARSWVQAANQGLEARLAYGSRAGYGRNSHGEFGLWYGRS